MPGGTRKQRKLCRFGLTIRCHWLSMESGLTREGHAILQSANPIPAIGTTMHFNWWRRMARSQRSLRPDRVQRNYRPQLEILEDRRLFSVAFGTPQSLNPGLSSAASLSGLVSGDFNGDGRLDLVTSGSVAPQLSFFGGV